LILSAALLSACSGITVSFTQTDATFRAAPTAKTPPRVLLDVAEVPSVPMRSVGLIRVAAPAEATKSEIARVAADKGRELGCAMLIEHSAFIVSQRQAHRQFGPHAAPARVLLVHGSGGGGGVVITAPSTKGYDARLRNTYFDCVVIGGEGA
jgi:hypothetical protein